MLKHNKQVRDAQAASNASVAPGDTAKAASNAARSELVRQRAELEAALLAYRCGWRGSDEIRIERLRRGLKAVLDALGSKDDPARALLEP